MAAIDVVFGPSAVREIKKLSKDGQKAIIELAESLRRDLRPEGVEKIQGHPRFYRVKKGAFRIIYCPLSIERVVVLVAADRKNAYRSVKNLDDRLASAKKAMKGRG